MYNENFNLTEELRSRTSIAHQDLENVKFLLPLGSKSITKEEYIEILKGFYGFFSPLESYISSHFQLEEYLPDYPERRKSGWIIEDLKSLNVPSDHLAFCTDFPHITSVASCFGVLYVMEGSTLGGSVIAKKIQTELGYDDQNGCHFFCGYKECTGLKWKTFKNTLSEFSKNNPSANEEVISTAINTFEKLKEWFNIRYYATTRDNQD